MKNIVHFVEPGAFINGYMDYMLEKFPQYNHTCISLKRNQVNPGINYLNSYNELFLNRKYSELKNKVIKSDKIIVSGNFHLDLDLFLLLYPHKLMKKTIVHLWGGDFYYLKRNSRDIKGLIYYYIVSLFFKKCKAIINLIPEDYYELKKIVNVSQKHFVAQMPLYRDELPVELKKTESKLNVLVGNSATRSNDHLYVFEELIKFKGQISVFCPLAYGDKNYAQTVIEKGKRLFGSDFHYTEEMMKKDEYNNYLNKIDVGIFANERQQALGNIYTLLRLKKKIYVKKGYPLWNNFNNSKKIVVYDLFGLKNEDYSNLKVYPEVIAKKNAELVEDFLFGERRDLEWKQVFDC